MITFSGLLKKAADYQTVDAKRLKKVYDFAKKAHRGQKRKKGEAFVRHPLTVAYYLTNYFADEDSIVAALLHDIVEDTNIEIEDIRKLFGENVACLIDGLTKINKEQFRDAPNFDRKIESVRKMFEIMMNDMRVGVIKLVDRLHNMETLSAHDKPQKEKQIARETLDVYAKTADYFGIWKIKRKLENLAFPYVYPSDYKIIEKIIDKKEKLATPIFLKIKKEILSLKKIIQVKDVIFQRKSLLQINVDKNYIDGDFELFIKDIFEVQIILGTEDACYQILQSIHKKWKPQEGSFVDYIQMPLDNGYQSLHTTVYTDNGDFITFHIQTEKMYFKNEYGVACYCFKKDRKGYPLSWLSRFKALNEDSKESSRKFWKALMHDILQKRIPVHVKDRIFTIPHNSTVLDFCYSFYHNRANYVKFTKVNNKVVSFDYVLEKGDTIEVFFDKTRTLDNSWLLSVNTEYSTNLITKSLKKRDRQEKIDLGKKILQQELDHYHEIFLDDLYLKQKRLICEYYNKKNFYEVLIMIGEGLIDPLEVVFILVPEKKIKWIDFIKRRVFHIREFHEKTYFLEIKGFLSQSKEVFTKLYDIISQYDSPLLIKDYFYNIKTKVFRIKAKIKVSDRLVFSKIILLLSRQPWITNVKTLLTFKQKNQMLVWCVMDVFLIIGSFFIPYSVYYIYSQLLLLLFVVFINFRIMTVFRRYFPLIRKKDLFLMFGLTLHIITISIIAINFLRYFLDLYDL